MNGVIATSRAKYPKVHLIGNDCMPRCGARAKAVEVSFLPAPTDLVTGKPIGDPKRVVKVTPAATNIQIDLGDVTCARCLKKIKQ